MSVPGGHPGWVQVLWPVRNPRVNRSRSRGLEAWRVNDSAIVPVRMVVTWPPPLPLLLLLLLDNNRRRVRILSDLLLLLLLLLDNDRWCGIGAATTGQCHTTTNSKHRKPRHNQLAQNHGTPLISLTTVQSNLRDRQPAPAFVRWLEPLRSRVPHGTLPGWLPPSGGSSPPVSRGSTPLPSQASAAAPEGQKAFRIPRAGDLLGAHVGLAAERPWRSGSETRPLPSPRRGHARGRAAPHQPRRQPAPRLDAASDWS